MSLIEEGAGFFAQSQISELLCFWRCGAYDEMFMINPEIQAVVSYLPR